MSGNFTQRGEAAIQNKLVRAECAVRAGADVVVELPLPFSVGNAELFAKGALKMLAAVPQIKQLAFGVECGKKEDFYALARLLNDEPPEYKASLKKYLSQGLSFAAAREQALKEYLPDADERLFTSPNCVLGLEYTRAILSLGAKIEILPLPRTGAGHGENTLKNDVSSASSIRSAILQNIPVHALPDYSKSTLPLCLTAEDFARLDAMEYYALWERSAERLAELCDCSEGLENALKSATKEYFSVQQIIERVTSKRYTSSRVRRILLCNLFSVTEKLQRELLQEDLYLRPLAIKKSIADRLFAEWKQTVAFPLLIRKGDEQNLSPAAKKLFDLTMRADDLYASLQKKKSAPYTVRFVED